MGDYVLGLDIGPNSIGWAMLAARFEESSSEPVEFTGFYDTSAKWPVGSPQYHPPIGVRVFEEGIPKLGTSKEESGDQSKSAQRRTARSMRRMHQRKNARREALRAVLTDARLLPSNPPEFDELMKLDPYLLRAKAIKEELKLFELGRVLYHLGQRRGFKSNRKTVKAATSGKGGDDTDKKVEKAIGILQAEIDAANSRTLGAHLYHQGIAKGLPVRRKFYGDTWANTRRDMYEVEFREIIAEQRKHHKALLTDARVAEIGDPERGVIFRQRSYALTDARKASAITVGEDGNPRYRANLFRSPALRTCRLFAGEKVCPLSEWIAQRFRVLKELNNLRVLEPFKPVRDLAEWGDIAEGKKNQQIYQRFLELLSTKDEVKFDDLRKELEHFGLSPDSSFNLERGSRKKIKGNEIDAALAKAFKKAWAKLGESKRRECRDALNEMDETKFRERFGTMGLSEDAVNKLWKFTPPDSHLAFSRKALEAIVPYMEGRDGHSPQREHEAIRAAQADGKLDIRNPVSEKPNLPSLIDPSLPSSLRDITNPLVRRALVEVRKVVNAIVREHGRPRRIVVELAREMKMTADERKHYSKKAAERRDEREAAKEPVREYGGNPQKREDVDRYLLWNRQDHLCPYSGKKIPQHLLFTADVDVDHVLPRHESGDDSFNNKVVCFETENKAKAKRSPAKWLVSDPNKYDRVLKDVAAMCMKGRMPRSMLARFGHPDPKMQRDFTSRQLNDTRYIARSVSEYLALLYPPESREDQKAVMSCTGGLTSELRRQWGLNKVLSVIDFTGGKQKPDSDGVSEAADSEEPTETTSAAAVSTSRAQKKRTDHRHHAVDAVVIALSSRKSIKRYSEYLEQTSRHKRTDATKPILEPPVSGLRGQLEALVGSINVSHRPMRKISGAFHDANFYGQVRDRDGTVVPNKYLQRVALKALTADDVNHKVRDKAVQKVLIDYLKGRGWNGTDKPKEYWGEGLPISPAGTPIRKVRVFVSISDDKGYRRNHDYHGQKGADIAPFDGNHHVEVVETSSGAWDAILVPMMAVAERVRQRRGPIVERNHKDAKFLMSLNRRDSLIVLDPKTAEEALCIVQTISTTKSGAPDIRVRDVRDSRGATEGNKTPLKRFSSNESMREFKIRKVDVDPLGRVSAAND